jgi:CRISPR-associated endonuclease/helicase Cas3
MASDIAPIDLLLQRSGRIHRHDRTRPERLARPELRILAHEEGEVGPSFKKTAPVYDEIVLLRTWLLLRDRTSVLLPAEIEPLIEAVYDDTRPGTGAALSEAMQERLHEASRKFFQEREVDASNAKNRLLPTPWQADSPFFDFALPLSEDDPDVHRSMQALTRLGGPSVEVVCLGPGDGAVDLDVKPDEAMTRRLLRRGLGVGHRGVIWDLLALPVPPRWRESPHLCRHRCLDFRGGPVLLGRYKLDLHGDIGLEIARTDAE